MRTALARHWPATRAGLIALAMIVGLLDGCPIPQADVMRQLPDWTEHLIVRADHVRQTLLRPFRWFGEDLKVTQRWALFQGAGKRRFRLVVEGERVDGTWDPVYVAPGDEDDRDAYGGMLAYRRVRGVYSPRGQSLRGQYYAFTAWMTARVLADYPSYVAARVRLERLLIGEGSYRATGEYVYEYTKQAGAAGVISP